MKNSKLIKQILCCISIVVVELILYYSISIYITNEKTDGNRCFQSENEFLRTIDCAPIFDAQPNGSYELTFEISAKKEGEILVYQQNGSNSRYSFWQEIWVTEEMKEVSIIINPILSDDREKQSYLSFYGEYGSGIIPTVQNIRIRLIE